MYIYGVARFTATTISCASITLRSYSKGLMLVLAWRQKPQEGFMVRYWYYGFCPDYL